MQTTLLGFAIAIILALVAALVGPFFIDWDSYRGELEARASRLTGLDFASPAHRCAAASDPEPDAARHRVRPPGRGRKVRARALRVEFALGSLVRGEWRIADARLEGPEFAAGLDGTGPPGLAGAESRLRSGRRRDRAAHDPGRPRRSFRRASGSRLVLDKLEFKGELRSLAGPIKGEGSLWLAGQHLSLSFSAGRIAEDGVLKVRLAVDPIDRPLTAEADVSIGSSAARRVSTAACISRAGRPRAGGRASADHRAVARHQPDQG